MTEKKWTPGPWVVVGRMDDSTYISMGDALRGPHKQFDLDLDWGSDWDKADAHLIGAALELYEALEDLFKELTLGDFELPTSLKPEIAQAARALAKARGEK